MTAEIRKGQGLPAHSISITMEGPDTEQGHVPVGVFTSTIQQVAGMLRYLDRQAGGDRRESFYLRVVALSHGSPANVVLEQCLVSPEVDRRDSVAEEFVGVMESIETEEDDREYSYELLNKASELTSPVGKTLRKLTVSTNGTQYDVDLGFRERLAEKLAPEMKSYGAIRGNLEYINIHGRQHVFRIYPVVGPRQVDCEFDDEVLERAKSAVGRFVEVRGVIKYKSVARYPREMKVSELEVLPGGGVEQLIAARGAFPDLTGDMTTEEHIAHVRSD